MINGAETQYRKVVLDILANGAYVMDRTGTGTLKRWAAEFHHYPAIEAPILVSKKVFFKAAVGELLWIYQDQSNDVNLLKEKYGIDIWDEWAGEDGTIGKAYGYQVKKHNQIDRLIDGLKNNPHSRRHRIDLMNECDAPEMNLEPCAFKTLWYVDPIQNSLNLTLYQRSGDMGLGVPFNMIQYAVLQHLIAHCTGYHVGEFKHYINDAHVYVNHINPLKIQLERDTSFCSYGTIKLRKDTPTDFYKIKLEDITLDGYNSHPHIPMDVSV